MSPEVETVFGTTKVLHTLFNVRQQLMEMKIGE